MAVCASPGYKQARSFGPDGQQASLPQSGATIESLVMSNIQVNVAALDAASAAFKDEPIYMVNLLRFNEVAKYDAAAEMTPCSGREAYYNHYMPAFADVIATYGVKLIFLNDVHAPLVSPAGETWDNIAIVEYTSFAVFREVLESAEYVEKAKPHILAALADLRLIPTTKRPRAVR